MQKIFRDNLGSELVLSSSVSAEAFVCGALTKRERARAAFQPLRFLPKQLRYLSSAAAWHPGLYKQMSELASGMSLRFRTDATKVGVELKVDARCAGVDNILKYMEEASFDGLSLFVDGELKSTFELDFEAESLLLDVDVADEHQEQFDLMLPGFAPTKVVELVLPNLHAVSLRELYHNGTTLEAVPSKEQLLVLGDSIMQGFVVGSPHKSAAWQLAKALDMDLLNQSVGGQVYQELAFKELAEQVSPALIVCELGCNYRYEPCDASLVRREVKAYFKSLAAAFPQVDCLVLGPLYQDEFLWPSNPRSAYGQLEVIVQEELAPYRNLHYLDGRSLMDQKESLLADIFSHPNAEGAAQIARRLTLATQMTASALWPERERALSYLEEAPLRVHPLKEMLKRGIGTLLMYTKELVVMAADDGVIVFWADPKADISDALALLKGAELIIALEPAHVREIAHTTGLSDISPVHLALYLKKKAPTIDSPFELRQLDESHLQDIFEHYSHPEWLDKQELRETLQKGRFIGAFEGEKLIGFIGEHAVGSMGLLEVFPEYQGQGVAKALEAALLERQLSEAKSPWAEIFPDNKVSLRLQRSLGMKLLPANEVCYMSRSKLF